MREDDCVMSGHLAHSAEASSSRAALPASDGTVARPEQERECVNVPPTHFSEAQAEQALRQEFRDHGASLNRALNEALRMHGGPAWRVF
jgi:ADP-dependent phosphofructokinase/glucokinase